MRRALAATMLALGLLAAQDAGAKDNNGRFGIGGARTLGGVQGFDFIYWAGRLGLTGTINLYLGFPGCPSGQTTCPDSFNSIKLAVGAIFPFIANEHVELGIGGRLNIGTAKGSDSHLALEAPLRLEWYVTDHFSLHAEVGVVIDLPPQSRVLNPGGGPSDGTAFIIGQTYVTGGGGFTVIF